jgi:hypothetical protein
MSANGFLPRSIKRLGIPEQFIKLQRDSKDTPSNFCSKLEFGSAVFATPQLLPFHFLQSMQIFSEHGEKEREIIIKIKTKQTNKNNNNKRKKKQKKKKNDKRANENKANENK